MKRLIIILCLLISMHGFSQTEISKELFPTLAGLQRTHTIEMYDHAPNDGKRSGGYPLPFASVKDTVINGKTYLQFGDYVNGSDYSLFFLREENNKVLIYSSILQNDLVLYDYTLELGDSLPAITSDHDYFSDDHFTKLDKAKDIFTYVVTDVSTVTLLDGIERKKWILKNKYLPIIEYVEGIGCYGENTSHSGDFFRLIYDHPYTTEYVGDHLVCVSKNGQLLYSMTQEEMNSFTLTCECLSKEDTIDPKDLFPTLTGLQRTVCYEYCGETEEDNSANFTDKQTFDSIFFENDKPYILCNDYLLREEDNKILIYSQLLNKDLVLYDFTLEVGDSLPALYIDYHARNAMDWIPYNLDVVDYNKDFDGTIYPADTFVVTGISSVTLLDGKKYKKWTFNNGMEYVEAIGMYGGRRNGNFFGLIQEVVVPCHIGTHLVCVSKNGKLLYQMDDAELERLNTECLCDGYQSSYKDQWCDQWNVLYHGWIADEIDMPITIFYQLIGDTIINEMEYKKLTAHYSMASPLSREYVAALRFSENKKVFIHYDDTEYLLYDFGAQVGDTLEIFGGIDHYKDFKTLPHVITEIDTLDDGKLQMQLMVNLQDEWHERSIPITWIEGVGSKDGVVQNVATLRIGLGGIELLCAYHSDECIYTTDNPYYTSLGCVYNDPIFSATEEVNAPTQSVQKIMYNGQLLILRDGKTYNVMGIEVK